MERFLPQAYPKQPSQWSDREKSLYGKLLADGGFDVVVVPLQVQGWGFDRAIRSLMTAQLAVAIAAGSGAKVADPFLVERAYGDGQRHYSRQEIFRVANAMGAKRVVSGFVGHDLAGNLRLSLTAEQISAGSVHDPARSFDKTAHFDASVSMLEAYGALVPQALQAIGIASSAKASARVSGILGPTELPDSPLQWFSGGDAIRRAYGLLLLNSLTPRYMERTKERFAEEAFLACAQIDPSAPEYRALIARSWMRLGLRPVALRLLDKPQTDEEKALLATLNGDLPAIGSLVSRETNPVKRLIETLDAAGMAADYGTADKATITAQIKAIKLPGKVWPWLAMRAATDWDSWSQFDNAAVKSILDHEFPIAGYSLRDIVTGTLSTGDAERVMRAANLAPFDHVRRYLESGMLESSRSYSAASAGAVEYLELLDAIGHDDLMRRMRFLASTQGVPQEALELANSLDSVYRGNPYYELQRAEAEFGVAQVSSDPERAGLIQSAYQRAFNALYWEQSQSRIASAALNELAWIGRHQYGYFDNLYHADLPYHPYYNVWSSGGNQSAIAANAFAALEDATSEFDSVHQLLGDSVRPADNGALMDRVSRAIAGRFVGDPECSDLLAKHALLEGNVSEAEALMRRSIKLAPNFEPTYLSLGTLLVENGDLKEGNAVFLSYPGFKNASAEQRVRVANAAFEMGSVFYGAGELQLAVPLYRISASQQTGAGGEMAAHIRLELLAGNLDAALRESLNRAQRYNDTRAYRDYLGMLHALKHSDEAWSAFRELSRDLQAPHIWETALVGHHIEGKSESEVLHWAQQREFSAAGEQRSYAAVYVARFATTDRTPSPELSDELARMERPVWQLDGAQGAVVRPSLDGTRQEVLGPVLVSGMPGVLPIGQFTGSGKRQVKSDLVYFVDGYRALKSGDAAAARPLFEAASRLYDLAGEVSYMLPYYALAAGKQGDTSRVEAILARFGPDARGFDYQLARAVIDGVAGKTEIALKELALARLRRPNTDERVLITQYTYGEICAMLFAATRDTRFRDAALNWARVREKVEPWQSWSFALVASLAPDSKERQEAIAMTHYLDPKSEALTRFSQAEIDTAVAAYPGHGIFTRKAGKAGNDLSI